jgi:vancomycin resistance protein VanW
MWMQYNKIINLKIAAKRLNGLIVHLGETFSYWRLIGKPTRRKGYVEGMTLFYGKVVPGIGGGLCQLSNLVYVFPDTDRSQPFGSGAICVYRWK